MTPENIFKKFIVKQHLYVFLADWLCKNFFNFIWHIVMIVIKIIRNAADFYRQHACLYVKPGNCLSP